MPDMTCTSCKSRSLERVRRSFLLKTLLGFLPVRTYRCWKCGRKTVRWQ